MTALLVPGTKPWLRLMTSSKVAAIMGVSPWESPRSMWHKMRNELPEEAQTSVQARGHYLEPAILAWWKDQHPEIPELQGFGFEAQPQFQMDGWAAATPDGAVLELDDMGVWTGEYAALVEAKSARDLDDWGTPGTDEIPPYYLTQIYWEMHVAQVPICYVPTISRFLDFNEYVVTYDRTIGDALEQRCVEFYESLEASEPPPLDDTVPTYDALRKLYRTIDDSAVEIPVPIAREYVEALAAKKAAEARERAAKSVVLELLGAARYAECGGVRVARRQPNKTGFQLNQVAKSTDDLPTEESSL